MSTSAALPGTRRSRWIPWVFVGGMGVVVGVNAVMITAAMSTWTGLVVPKPYERGVRYNAMLEAQQRQDALGWSLSTRFEATAGPLAGKLIVLARDADGQPLDGLALDSRLARPIEPMAPLPVDFSAEGGGRYVARIDLPKPGQWELRSTVRLGDDSYILVDRVVVK